MLNRVKLINSLREEADRLLNLEIEAEMRKIIKHPKIGTVLKGMGVVTVYGNNGEPYDVSGEYGSKPPRVCNRLFKLADMDPLLNSLSGHPLRISKEEGIITELRDW